MRIFLLVMSLVAFPALSAWELNNSNSTLNFTVTSPNGGTETHQFDQLMGDVDAGVVNFTIDLESINTLTTDRNLRIQEYLFKVIGAFSPEATFNGSFNVTDFDTISAGSSGTLPLTGNISLYGDAQPVSINVLVTKSVAGDISVSSQGTFNVDASNFSSLATGIQKIADIAGIASFNNIVPVSFFLAFIEIP